MVEQKSVPVLEREHRRNLKTAEFFKHLRSVGFGVAISAVLTYSEKLGAVGVATLITSDRISGFCEELAAKKTKRIQNIYNRRQHPSVASEETS